MLGGELMMDRREKAVGLKHNGHNCCQAVLCAFADELPLAEEDLNCIGAAYGVGMGCMEATCGSSFSIGIYYNWGFR